MKLKKEKILKKFEKEIDGLLKGKWVDRNGAWMVKAGLKKVLDKL